MIRLTVVLAATLLAATSPSALALAQDSVTVAEGARVRALVVPPGVWRVGSVARLAPDTLFLYPGRCMKCAPEAVPRAAVAHFDASAGPGGHPFRGMAIGLVAGAAIGAFVIAPCPHGNAGGGEGVPCGLGQTYATAAGALVGLFVGTAVGELWPPRERWRPARWP